MGQDTWANDRVWTDLLLRCVSLFVEWNFDGVLNQLLQSVLLAHEFDELWLVASAAHDYQLFLLVEELLDGAAIFLVKKLVDLSVSSKHSQK